MKDLDREASADEIHPPMPLDPKPRESFRGYVLRVAEQELCSFGTMRLWLGCSPSFGPELAPSARTAALLDIPIEDLERMGANRRHHSAILGIEVPPNMVSRHRMRFCPACLAEDRFHRGIWELAAVTVCPIHRIALVAHCPSPDCGKLLTWKRVSIDKCECGAELSQALHVPAKGTCAGAAALHRRCGLEIDGICFPEAFQNLPMRDLLEIMGFLGKMDLVVAGSNTELLSGRSLLKDNRVLDAAAAIIGRWPEGFVDLAERIARARAHLNGAPVLEPLHRFISMNLKRSYGPILQEGLRSLADRQRGASTSTALQSADPRRTIPRVSSQEARDILQVSPSEFNVIKKTSLWRPVERETEWCGEYPFYPEEQIRALANHMSSFASFKAAAAMLGVDRSRDGCFFDLVAGGFLSAFCYRAPLPKRLAKVRREDVQRLLTAIERNVTDMRPSDPMTFDEVLKPLSARFAIRYPLASLFRLLVQGNLRGFVANPDEIGIRRLTFERSDVERASRDPERLRWVNPTPLFSIIV